MGERLPEYTQREINELFARFILGSSVVDHFTPYEDLMMLRYISTDWYILKEIEE